METQLQNALQNLIKDQATPEEIELLQQAFLNGQIFIGGNVQNSIIIAGNGNTIHLSAEALELLTAAKSIAALHQLPQPPIDFVGRRDELKTILKSIAERKGASISGLTGMGGIGKTALGLVAAHELISQYPDAQFFIDLRGTTKKPLKPIDVMKHVVQSFYPTADLKDVTESELAGEYHSVLLDKKVIIFLDNASDAGQVIPLIPPQSCCVFITSRWQFPVPGLNHLRLELLKVDDAIQLLINLCPRINHENARQIASLCGYLPLALRLAGGYLQINMDWSPEEYIAELSKKNEKLKALSIERSDSNLEIIFAQSYKRLSRGDQNLWNMLAVFPAPFDRSAIKDIWGFDDDVAHKLASKLFQYNLIEYDSIGQRYRLHDLLLEFANKRLKEPQKGTSLLNYFTHYNRIWLIAEDYYKKRGDGEVSGLGLFDAERVHIETAFQWAIEIVSTSQVILPVFREFPNGMEIFRMRFHPEQQIKWFQSALLVAQKTDNRSNQNKLLGYIGAAFMDMGEGLKAIEYFEQALEIAKEVGNRQSETSSLGFIGACYASVGEWSKGVEYFKKALEIAREIGDRSQEGIWLGNLGSAYGDLNQRDKGIEYLEQALIVVRETGDRYGESRVLGNLGSTYANLGKNHKAIEYYNQALEIARDLGDHLSEDQWMQNIGIAYCNMGEFIKGIEYYEQSLVISREIGDRNNEGFCLGSIGEAYKSLDRQNEAIEFYVQALEIAREIGNRQLVGFWLGNIGESYSYLNHKDDAIEYYEQALEVAREVGDEQREGEWHNLLGEFFVKIKSLSQAKQHLEYAMTISKKLGSRELEAKCNFNFAKLFQLQQNKELALRYAQEARSVYAEMDTPNLAEVIQFIESLNRHP